MQIEMSINGQDQCLDLHPGTLLLDLLREQGLHSVKGSEENALSGCGSVLVDGKLIDSSIYLAAQAHKREVLTVEAFGTPERPHPIQEAFVEAGAIQCDSCSPGMVLATYELISSNPEPSESDAREALSGLVWRCSGHATPVEAVLLAARKMREGRDHSLPGRRAKDSSSRLDKVGAR